MSNWKFVSSPEKTKFLSRDTVSDAKMYEEAEL
jgi:hypothetical protein